VEALYGSVVLCGLELAHTAVVAPNVIAGNGLTITVKLVAVDMHPFVLLTVIVPVYAPGAVFAGIGMLIGLVGKLAFVTGAKVLVGLEFQVML